MWSKIPGETSRDITRYAFSVIHTLPINTLKEFFTKAIWLNWTNFFEASLGSGKKYHKWLYCAIHVGRLKELFKHTDKKIFKCWQHDLLPHSDCLGHICFKSHNMPHSHFASKTNIELCGFWASIPQTSLNFL